MPGDPTTPVSIVLPTREWTPACAELAAQAAPSDELFFVCDRPSDPVVDAAAGTAATVVVAGEPETCSGKCNALAAGLARARATTGWCVRTPASSTATSGWTRSGGASRRPRTATCSRRRRCW
ncbi:MAG: hypothetical protein R6U01_05755 [Halorubrum sp.]|uniref:hypothetical protein n=1 Tax=Halorubrum sp. TaxID=1879286 RepID=UPI003970D09D